MRDRFIDVEKPVTVVKRVEVPLAPKRGDWPNLLAELVRQVDSGRVYDRDLCNLAEALDDVLNALGRRRKWR